MQKKHQPKYTSMFNQGNTLVSHLLVTFVWGVGQCSTNLTYVYS